MIKKQYKPKEFKALVSRLLEENHNICKNNGLPNSFYKSISGEEVLSNFDQVFNSFVSEFPYTNVMSKEDIKFTFKVLLQQQLDVYWYSGFKTYSKDLEIINDSSLVNLLKDKNRFCFLELPPGKKKVSRFKRILLRIGNSRFKYCQGLYMPYAPLAMYNFLNNLCQDVKYCLIITNTIRSQEYQNQLVSQGKITPNESSHLYGYTADIEQRWLKRYKPEIHKRVVEHLQKLEELGEIIFIDYGSIWHVVLSPAFHKKYLIVKK